MLTETKGRPIEGSDITRVLAKALKPFIQSGAISLQEGMDLTWAVREELTAIQTGAPLGRGAEHG